MAAGRFKHATSSCRSVLGTAGHDAKPPYSALIHAVISESEWAAPRNKPSWLPSIIEATCNSWCSGWRHGCPALQARHQQL